MILVTGATGHVGRELLPQLLKTGAGVRALTRDPRSADLPPGVEVVRGDLSEPESLGSGLVDVDAVFLLWPFTSPQTAAELAPRVVEAIAERATRIVYLSAQAAGDRPDSFWATVERAIEATGVAWTFLRPTGFATNTLMWTRQIRESDVLRWPYGDAARSLIHERDIAAVAARALTEDGHAGARHVLTGPAAVTQREQLQAIGAAVGRSLRWEELGRDDARSELAATFGDPAFAESALNTWAGFVSRPELVTETVREITGTPAHTFARWAADHADDFR